MDGLDWIARDIPRMGYPISRHMSSRRRNRCNSDLEETCPSTLHRIFAEPRDRDRLWSDISTSHPHLCRAGLARLRLDPPLGARPARVHWQRRTRAPAPQRCPRHLWLARNRFSVGPGQTGALADAQHPNCRNLLRSWFSSRRSRDQRVPRSQLGSYCNSSVTGALGALSPHKPRTTATSAAAASAHLKCSLPRIRPAGDRSLVVWATPPEAVVLGLAPRPVLAQRPKPGKHTRRVAACRERTPENLPPHAAGGPLGQSPPVQGQIPGS
jgi:hypothetical protein